MKTCSKCLETKALTEFNAEKRTKDGRTAMCKVCRVKQVTDHQNSLPIEQLRASQKAARIKWTYNLTMDEYNSLMARGCEVCGTHSDLRIDHDHACCAGQKTCGKCIRGTLCDRHNTAEGLLRGNPDEAMALAAYMLKGTNIKEVLVAQDTQWN